MADVLYRGSRPELAAILRRIPAVCAGREADPNNAVKSLLTRIGVALLSQVQQDFILKSRGGTGRDGIKWKPLSRKTIAQRRVSAGERKAAGIKGKRVRGLLTPAQDKRWKMIFATKKFWLMAKGLGEGEASARAAQIAWAVLKSEGAQTKLAVFGGRSVEIMRDTSVLFRSLSPGIEDKPYTGRDSDKQVFETAPARVIVGTRVPYAGRQFRTRPAWPADGMIPAAWWPAILLAAQRGVVRMVALLLGRR